MEKIHRNMHVFVFKIYIKAQKHARFHVLSSFSSPLHHNDERSITAIFIFISFGISNLRTIWA